MKDLSFHSILSPFFISLYIFTFSAYFLFFYFKTDAHIYIHLIVNVQNKTIDDLIDVRADVHLSHCIHIICTCRLHRIKRNSFSFHLFYTYVSLSVVFSLISNENSFIFSIECSGLYLRNFNVHFNRTYPFQSQRFDAFKELVSIVSAAHSGIHSFIYSLSHCLLSIIQSSS